MMRPRNRIWVSLLLLGLAAQGGCVTLKESIEPAPTGPGGPSTLPPAQPLAAFHEGESEALCLKAAAKYEENNCAGEAIVQLEKARAINPKLNVSHRLALLYEGLEDYPKALAEYNKELAAAKQNDTDVLNNILAGLKKLVGKETVRTTEADLLNDIGYCLFLKRDWAESEKYLRESLAKNADNETAWVNLGLVLAAQNRVEESLDVSQHAVSLSAAYANVAYVQVTRLNHLADAMASYRKALELDPENKKARGALTELEQVEKKEAAKPAAPRAPGLPG